ncbi:pirin family protein [Acinetobacter boissieri]|uniref:Redox-sensitive bicupin YhaK, pirin superfamily n=1 Tax=Acinetobacter boissieri TaxID=1219383 RepID=A0A1G6GMN2_9GAMM|nr:pirin family protein [Acinetobacter boissieri]SDB82985.1 Redox-sensitive bicupin YhaK, pirin superfamily [Acinetobacter boissieri]
MSNQRFSQRSIIQRTFGSTHGYITRLMSPSDLGQIVKPFVFLDIFSLNLRDGNPLDNMPLHPHSGIATITVITEGKVHYDDPHSGSGSLTYGGVEWSCAGGGMWHGKELSVNTGVPYIQGFQLWIALPREVENGLSESHYIEAKNMHRTGPAFIILGSYEGVQSPVPAPKGMNYLLVTLSAGEIWTYQPPLGHSVAWLAVATGQLSTGEDSLVNAGEMVIFEQGETPLTLKTSGNEKVIFVLGSAVPHPYTLHLGNYSVHTSAQALKSGEQRISELGKNLREAERKKTALGIIPVFR